MKSIFWISVSILFSLAIGSCDVIDAPFTKTVVEKEKDSTKRKILFEEFTGQDCPNCPNAHRVLAPLEELYGSRLITVGIHEGAGSEPSVEFPIDYRTEEGSVLSQIFKATANPTGLVNRTKFEGKSGFFLGRTSWGTFIEKELSIAPQVDISLHPTFDATTRTVQGYADIRYLKSQNSKLYVVYYIVEDSIVSKQKDGFETIENYVHKNVLRASIKGAFGEEVSGSDTVSEQTTIRKNFSFTFPQSKSWVFNKCKLICFVHTNKPNYNVLQAEEINFPK